MNKILMAVILIGVAGVTLADSPGTAMKPVTSFGYLDTDKDLRVSPGEAKASDYCWISRNVTANSPQESTVSLPDRAGTKCHARCTCAMAA